MLNSLANQARSANLRWIKSVAVAIWGPALALMLFFTFVLSALGNLVGLHGGEIAVDFLVVAAGPGLLVPSKFSLTLFIPQLTGTEVWPGHETLTPVVFLAVWVAGLVSTLISSMR